MLQRKPYQPQVHCNTCMLILKIFTFPGIRSKLLALAKQTASEIIGGWAQSLVLHLYWSASSTPEGQGDLLLAKWLSVLNHIQNIHDGHDDLFPACEHGPLEGEDRQKDWIEPGMSTLSL